MLRKIIFPFFIHAALISGNAQAHDRWLVPSHTQLSGDDRALSVDFSISNQIFHADKSFGSYPITSQTQRRSPMLMVTSPSGINSDPLPYYDVVRKSTAGISLSADGTHRISLESDPIKMTFFTKKDGSKGRVFGGKSHPDIPQGTTLLNTINMHAFIDTFVSLNGQTDVKARAEGLSLVGHHPNDLFVGEAASFTILLNEQVVKSKSDVVITRGATRYRNERKSVALSTNENGQFSHTFTHPGFYLLQVSVEQERQTSGVDKDRYVMFVTLEVLPQ